MKIDDKVARFTKANKLLRRQLAQAVDLADRLSDSNRQLAQSNNALRDQLSKHTSALKITGPSVVSLNGHELGVVEVAPTIIGATPE
jgi:hypothetical protein